ncbi:MAG: hypothetical protein OEL53_04455 [Rhodospirillales bacterium]|nr:hypothetical protein [Rhodospirillales bacterium]
MTIPVSLDDLRQRGRLFAALPNDIVVDSESRSLETATLDDVAFAQLRAEADYNAAGDRYHALRRLYATARENGAMGADLALAFLPEKKEGR